MGSSIELAARTFRVRSDSFQVRTADGVWLRNRLGSFSVKGAQSYALLSALLEQLDGSQSIEEICAELPAGHRAVVLGLAKALLANGFLKEVDGPPEPVPELIDRLYPEHIAFLDQYVDRPVQRFLAVRSASVRCVGDGTALRALTTALAEFGLRQVSVAPTEEVAGLPALVSAAGVRDPEFNWRFDEPDTDDADVVLVATDGPLTARIPEFEGKAHARGAAFGALTSIGGLVLATPLSTPDTAWIWSRLRDCIAAADPDLPAPLPPAATSLAAYQLVHRAFSRLAGPDVPLDQRLTSVQPRTLAMGSHPVDLTFAADPARVLRSAPPLRITGAPIRPDIPSSFDSPAILAEQDRIVTAIHTWTDALTGVVLEVGEGDLPQLPLAASRCTLRSPADNRTLNVTCHALTPREARNQVVLAGLEHCARAVAADPALRLAAGYSPGEALYRALAGYACDTARDTAGGPGTPRPLAVRADEPTASGFLVGSLARSGVSGLRVTTGPAALGFRTASVFAGDRVIGTGVGLTDESATTDALLAAASPPQDHTARLAPHTNDFADALAGLAMPAVTALDVTGLLPFLGGSAWLVAVSVDREQA